MNKKIEFEQTKSGSWTAKGYLDGELVTACTCKRISDAKADVEKTIKVKQKEKANG